MTGSRRRRPRTVLRRRQGAAAPSGFDAAKLCSLSFRTRLLVVAACVLSVSVLAGLAWWARPASERICVAVVPRTTTVPGIDLLADAAVLALLASYLVSVWLARRSTVRLAVAVAGAVGVLVGYLTSELVKIWVAEERPCRAVLSLTGCPPPGDWSFPSNHVTIAGGIAVAVVVLHLRAAAALAALVMTVAVGRFGEGAHYPHDLVAGVGLGAGAVVTAVLMGAPAIRRGLDATRRIMQGAAGRAGGGSPDRCSIHDEGQDA